MSIPNRHNFIFLFLILFGLSVSADANDEKTHLLDPKKSISQYTLKTWGIDNGLPSLSLTDIVQSKQKYIWVGTYNGLVRFDGVSFQVYNVNNVDALGSSAINTLAIHNDRLWVGTNKGLAYFENHKFHTEPKLEELATKSIEKLYVDRDGALWIGTTSDGFFVFMDQKLYKISHPQLETSPIKLIAEDALGKIWVGSDAGGLFQVAKREGKATLVLSSETTKGLTSFYLDNTGVLWIGTKKQLLYVSRNRSAPTESPIVIGAVNSIVEGNSGYLWLANNEGVHRVSKDGVSITHYTEEQGLPNNLIRKLLFDHQGNLWIASYRSGLFQLTDGVFTCFSTSEGMSDDVVTSTIQIDSNTYWLGTERGRINVLANGELSLLQTSQPLPVERLKHLMYSKEGYIWVSTYGGLVKLDRQGVVQPLPTAIKNIEPSVRLTFQDREGNIWVGTRRQGLYKISWGGGVKHISIKEGLSSAYVMSIDQNGKGEIVVGTKNGVNILKEDKVIRHLGIEEGLPSTLVFDVLMDDGVMWVCTDLGLTKFVNGHVTVFNVESGLPDNVVFDVVKDKNGQFWLSSNYGVIQIAEKELEAYEKGEIKLMNARLFDKSDGMKSELCVGATKMYLDAQHVLWIPTVKGVASLDLNDMEAVISLPEPFIEQVFTESLAFYPSDQQSISIQASDAKRLTFDFTSFDFIAPNKSKFKYRLLPFDPEWQTPPRNAREVIYTNLPPARYTFQVMAGNHSEVWNERYATVHVDIKPLFYQTWWFIVLCAVVFLIATYLAYYSRLRIAKKKEQVLKERVTQRTQELLSQKQELEETYEELKATQSKVVQSEKMASLGQLTAGIAHEINNPVNFVFAGADALKTQLTDLMQVIGEYERLHQLDQSLIQQKLEEIASFKSEIVFEDMKEDVQGLLSDIVHGANRTAEIVKSLRVFARDDSTEFRPEDLHEILDSTLIILRNTYKERVEIIKDYQAIPLIPCAAGKIGQVFTNIITNAIQAIEGEGTVTVHTSKAEGEIVNSNKPEKKYVLVAITDTGTGIPDKVLSKVFDPFFTTKDVGKGTGLGLSISQDIIDQHQGIVKIDTEEGKGTTFSIYLPLVDYD